MPHLIRTMNKRERRNVPVINYADMDDVKEDNTDLDYEPYSTTRRSPRNLKRIDYTGMDMTEDDEGKVSFCRRRFENGKVIYRWESRPLCEVNELGDELFVIN
jgi:hypothetical protein